MRRFLRVPRLLTLTSVLAIAASLGCKDNPTQPSPFAPGQSFELRPGASAMIGDGLKITFQSVTSDSRCPMDAICVWAGDATVALSISKGGGGQVERELHTLPTGSEASYPGYSIKLEALAPYPRSGRPIRPEEYVATLIVTAQ